MQTQEALRNRCSIRSFSGKIIPPDLIEKIIDAARFAPTARNLQPWEFIAVTEKPALREIASLAENGRFIAECACCIAVFCKDTKYYLEDGCAATENILLSAADFGIASCWVAGDKKPYCDDVRKLLGVPEEFKLVSLAALGYSDEDVKSIAKRPLKEVLHWEKF